MKRFKIITPILLVIAMLVSIISMSLPVAAAEIAMAKNTVVHAGDPVHPTDVYLVGQMVHYEMSITNTSTTQAMTIQITDTDPSGTVWYYIEGTDSFELAGPASHVTLDPLEVWEHDFHHILQMGDLYPHPVLEGVNIFTNRISADGTQGIDLIEATVTKTSQGVQPEISVTKEADNTISKIGDTINYTITIENTGDWPLEGITVVDDILGDLSAMFADTLAVGASDTQVIPYVVPDPEPADPLVNIVTAEGVADGFDTDVEADIGPVVSDTATDSVDLVHPGISITKEADVEFSKVGDTVNYTIIVTNTGDVALINVDVTDSLLGDLWVDGTLAVGASMQFDEAYVVQAGDPDPLVNVATASAGLDGLDNVIGPVEARVEVDLVHPGISLTKECTPGTGAVGDIITYTITIENTGDVDLENVTVTDILLGDLSASFVDYLAVGASDTQQFTRAIMGTDVSPLVNTATVNANVIVIGNPVTDSDSCEVIIMEEYEGLTPGFWKNHPDLWVDYDPEDLVGDVFDIPAALNELADDTLMEALNYKGGSGAIGAARNLLRQAVAALLNASHPDVDYAMTEAEIIDAVNDALASLDRDIMNMLKDQLDMYNNAGGGIDAHGNPIP
ncbi:MAG: DUF7507 domain-containing protein [Saccharofermentanales bacterium]